MDFDKEERCNTPDEIQEMFNRVYLKRIISGELVLCIRSSKPARAAWLPPGSKTNMYGVFDQEMHVANVHLYEDGLGNPLASKILDPKALLIGRIMYFYRPPDKLYHHG